MVFNPAEAVLLMVDLRRFYSWSLFLK